MAVVSGNRVNNNETLMSHVMVIANTFRDVHDPVVTPFENADGIKDILFYLRELAEVVGHCLVIITKFNNSGSRGLLRVSPRTWQPYELIGVYWGTSECCFRRFPQLRYRFHRIPR